MEFLDLTFAVRARGQHEANVKSTPPASLRLWSQGRRVLSSSITAGFARKRQGFITDQGLSRWHRQVGPSGAKNTESWVIPTADKE